MIAYLNDFTLMMWLSFAAIPLVLFMKKPPLAADGAAHGENLPH